jgi:hypothetical protein
MLTVIDIAHVHLGAEAALVQPLFKPSGPEKALWVR